MKVATPRRVSMQVPMYTDAIHPESLVAAFKVGVELLSGRADREGMALDWSTLQTAMAIDVDEEGTSLMVIRTAIL